MFQRKNILLIVWASFQYRETWFPLLQPKWFWNWEERCSVRKWLLNSVWIKFFWVTNLSNMHWLKIAIIFFLYTYDFQVEVGWSDLSRRLQFILGSDGLGFLLGLSLSKSANSGVWSGEVTATGGCSSQAFS